MVGRDIVCINIMPTGALLRQDALWSFHHLFL